MARDFLAIPLSTVASESTFSTAGMVIDKYRSSLSSETVEALICAKDWLKGSQMMKMMMITYFLVQNWILVAILLVNDRSSKHSACQYSEEY